MATAVGPAPPPGGWPTAASDLTFLKKIGRGYFGEVWKALLADVPPDGKDPMYLAIKKVPLSLIKQHNLLDQMDREIDIQFSLKHPRIVQLLFHFRDSSHVYLGMEFADGGGMFDKLTKARKFSNANAAQYFYETCDALEYMHQRKIVHRDIKPENILLDRDGRVKLADFGWSNAMESQVLRQTFCGTPDYLAPEMIRGQGHKESLDMWEMGVLLYEMLVGKSPFGSKNQETTCRRILQVDLCFPIDIDADAVDLIKKLCTINPDDRLTAKQAKQHKFVTKHHGVAGDDGSGQSVVARMLGRELEKLQGELLAILQAKCVTEQELLRVTADLETMNQKLRQEQKLTEVSEKHQATLKEREGQQTQEVEQLQKALGADGATKRTGRRSTVM